MIRYIIEIYQVDFMYGINIGSSYVLYLKKSCVLLLVVLCVLL